MPYVVAQWNTSSEKVCQKQKKCAKNRKSVPKTDALCSGSMEYV